MSSRSPVQDAWLAAYAAAFALEVQKRKGGRHPKSLSAIASDAPQMRAFACEIADLAVADEDLLRRRLP